MDFCKSGKMFEEAVSGGLFSAGAIAIGQGSEIFLKKTAGTVSFDSGARRVDEKTLFDMASLSKILATTMCAFGFIDGGKISLDDRLGRFFDAVPADKAHITVKDLMTHTSGFPSWLPLYTACGSPDDAADYILRSPLAYETGKETRYSCMGYIVLGKILEKISGKRLDVLAKENVFDPFSMKNTGYRQIGECAENDNIAYTEKKTKWGGCICGEVHDENARFLGGISGNAGVFSCLDDMIIFAQKLSLGRGGVSEELFAKALVNYTAGMDGNRGLGFQLCGPVLTFAGPKWGEYAYGHTGFTGTSLMIDGRTGFYTVLLTNRVHPVRDTPAFFEFRRNLHSCIFDEYNGLDK